MWAKISSALKRPETPAQDTDHDESYKPPSVLSAVFSQHPNLSNFHEPSEVPFPSPSPPASPSKHGRRGIFKRTPKAFTDSDQGPQLPIKLSIPHLKKVKSSIQPNSASSDASSSRASIESSQPRQSEDSLISPEVARGAPITPTADKFNSLRSILRDGNTPATGQSVRFFSRDAYKIISPDVSAATATSSEPEPSSFAARIKSSSNTPARPTVQDVFSPPQSSLMKPLPPPNTSNIFDLSQDVDVPLIPISKDTPLLDTAIELPSDADFDGTVLRSEIDGGFRSSTPLNRPQSGIHDRSQSFSFGQTIFHSLNDGGRDSPVSPANSSGSFSRGSFKLKGSRSRAYSDTVFHSFGPSLPPKEASLPEADIDDRSNGAVVVYTTPESPEKEKDPFGANAKAYYTPGTGVPPTPPSSAPAHSRKASREEDLILSLRTQLALQTELCAQYEVDLGARDEMMRVLQSRLDEAEKECERRKTVIRSWRKRVADLERCVHALQDEVDRSREESAERSVMDEASGQALRTLHRRIEELERDKAASEKREQRTTEELKETKAALDSAKEELARRDEAERELKDGIARAKEQIEMMDVSMDADAMADRSRTFSIAAWEEERKALTAANESLRADNLTAQTQLADAREEAMRANNELAVLKAELEAQWHSTEQQTERIAELEKERDELRGEVDALNARISEMEGEWTQAENRKNEVETEVQELWAAKEELETQRNEFKLQDQLRTEQEHSEELTRALREREDKVIALEHEQKFAQERVTRLETRLRERETELSELSKKQSEREADAETAQSEIAKMKREHARIVNEQSRTLQDVVAREVEARAAMEAMVREKAEADVQLTSLKERSEVLTAEVERLRRQVHDLQQESADKEMKLAQFVKQRAQDKEDLNGLNIALDSKQQELDLLKRRLSVRGTAGSTPASTAKVQPHRRESSIFGTPTVVGSRPPSALSDTGSITKDRRMGETPSTATKSTLGKSVRANGTPSTSASTSVAPKKRSLEGAMGPPPSRTASANAAAATPTRIPSGPSGRATPSTIKAPAHQRRMSASILEPSKLRMSTSSREKLEKLPSVSSASEPEEKENSAPSSRTSEASVSSASSTASATKAARRMSALPA
ncbi:hypothetical protein BD414DRAFT_540487 [Trametes punicea]|nr:hypothetical protein BD414DRAFT_540487 [Trametes punicea]